MFTAIVLDTETTGLENPQVIEAAYQNLRSDLSVINDRSVCYRFMPNKPIEQGAINVHGITLDTLKGMPASAEMLKHMPGILYAKYVIGHNIQYDIDAINLTTGRNDVFKAICTKRLAYEVLDHQPSYSLVKLCENLNLVCEGILKEAHSAAFDVYMTTKLIQHISKTLEQRTGKTYQCADLFELYQSLPDMSYEDYKTSKADTHTVS